MAGGRELQGAYPFELGTHVDSADQIWKEEIHGGLGALKLRKRREERAHQNKSIGVVTLQRSIALAWRHFLELEFHGAHSAFRKVRRKIVFQVGRQDGERWRLFQREVF